MVTWGDRWACGAGDPPVELTHVTCGNVVHAVPACDHCGEQLHWRDLRADPLPARQPV